MYGLFLVPGHGPFTPPSPYWNDSAQLDSHTLLVCDIFWTRYVQSKNHGPLDVETSEVQYELSWLGVPGLIGSPVSLRTRL